ncbi:hypothetical protein [Maridesulfovibrio ferrireducens]|uniref:hypothetical protein n=1 Tax=Maridesulfovibrio ferrireducens TaxID=246191 RepID=UPI0026F32695|nr:hypothetical protein [Maridesulfovibrio ferrireducens]
MIILFNKHDSASVAFAEQYKDSANVIDWYENQSLIKIEFLTRDILPRSFPSIASDVLPVIIEPETDPASELLEAEKKYLQAHLSTYGATCFGYSFSSIVADGVLDLDQARNAITAAIKVESQRRILEIWSANDIEESLIKQMNVLRADMNDSRFIKTDAIRTASNDFEISLKNMTRKALSALVIAEWDGWPSIETETIEGE